MTDLDSVPIYINDFDSTTINSVFGWVQSCSVQLQSNQAIVEMNILPQIQKQLDNVIFEEYTKIFNRNILELVKAADYFDIQSMTDSLVVYIAKELMTKSNQEIYATLYGCIFYVPHKFKRNVLCVIITNSMHHNNLHFKHELNGVIANGSSFVEKCLNKKYFSQNLDINDFTFLSKIKGNFIQYEETKEFGSFLKHQIAYPNIKLDLMNKIKFRLYIEHFLDREDRHGTMIAGGIFSVYQSQSLFA